MVWNLRILFRNLNWEQGARLFKQLVVLWFRSKNLVQKSKLGARSRVIQLWSKNLVQKLELGAQSRVIYATESNYFWTKYLDINNITAYTLILKKKSWQDLSSSIRAIMYHELGTGQWYIYILNWTHTTPWSLTFQTIVEMYHIHSHIYTYIIFKYMFFFL
jgi:hypothetical protein